MNGSTDLYWSFDCVSFAKLALLVLQSKLATQQRYCKRTCQRIFFTIPSRLIATPLNQDMANITLLPKKFKPARKSDRQKDKKVKNTKKSKCVSFFSFICGAKTSVLKPKLQCWIRCLGRKKEAFEFMSHFQLAGCFGIVGSVGRACLQYFRRGEAGYEEDINANA